MPQGLTSVDDERMFSSAGGGNAGAAGAAAEPFLAGATGAAWRRGCGAAAWARVGGFPGAGADQLHPSDQQFRAGDRRQTDQPARGRAQCRPSYAVPPPRRERDGRLGDADVAGRHAGAGQGRPSRQGRDPRPRRRRRRPDRTRRTRRSRQGRAGPGSPRAHALIARGRAARRRLGRSPASAARRHLAP